MAPLTPAAGARTGAISVTAVLTATGLLAAPAEASTHQSASRASEGSHMTTDVRINPASIERALAPAAAPIVIASVAPAAAPAALPAAATRTTHTVKRGDTVWDIARHYGSTVTAIIDANDLDRNATIRVGEKLVIPGAAKAAKATKQGSTSKKTTRVTGTHTVRSGDTVWDIAQRYDSTVSAIVSANKLGSNAVIHVGDRLTIPGAKAGTTTTKATTASGTTKSSTKSSSASSRYTVKSGDTLSAIARKFSTTVAKLVSTNGIDNPSRIRVGQVLTIPGGVPTGLVGDTFAGRTYSSDIVSAANVNKHTLNNMSVPSRAQMRALVEKTAKKYGVNVSLALAVAYQESGFNQRAVSPANAVGTMQVIPSTGEWVSTMVGRELNLLDPHDNVTAGVVLLRYLTRNADSLDQAIAGYYQGLGGVRKYGMNKDTKQYVKSVRALMKKFD
ncbi:LysM peptidoglycan-binding domain-containing protein [Demequina sp.]|uniref:lytic transglycosylase n=1 Tax=Demequina sp. TaxID=2050685 RepID=UPI003D0BFC34